MSDGNTINQAEYQRALNQAISRKQKIRELEMALAEKDKALASLQKEHEDWAEVINGMDSKIKGFEAEPSELQQKVQQLQGELKSRDHRAAFEKMARAFKGEKGEVIRQDALEALYKLAGSVPDGDLPDEASLAKTLGAAVAANPFVLAAPEQGGGAVAPGTTPALAAKPPGPGVSRGTPDATITTDPTATAIDRMAKVTGHRNPLRIA